MSVRRPSEGHGDSVLNGALGWVVIGYGALGCIMAGPFVSYFSEKASS